MAADLWQQCQGQQHIRPLQCRGWRLVESQEQAATMTLASSAAGQGVLEALIDASKPRNPAPKRHYLISTPFRYPPLPWGSRFGSRFEPSLFYAGKSPATTFAESAYYRFVFLQGLTKPFSRPIVSHHTLFSVNFRTARGVDLTSTPFDSHRKTLAHPADYQATQALGKAMREANVQAFTYLSARDPEQGHCIAAYTPEAINSKTPERTQAWVARLTHETIGYAQQGSEQRTFQFERQCFLVGGALPLPAG